jgi:nucleotide-binding universal stress UspA family protein
MISIEPGGSPAKEDRSRDIERQWLPQGGRHSGVLIVTNADPSSATTIRCGVAIADRQQVPVAILSVLCEPIVDLEPRPGQLEDLTSAHADMIRHRVCARITEATDTHRQIPIYVVRGPLGPAAGLAAEIWGASLVVVGLGRPGPLGLPRSRDRLHQIVNHARRHVLAVSPTAPTVIGRTILTADFGGTSVAADERAMSLVPDDAPVTLVHVVPDCRTGHDARPRWTQIYSNAVSELFENTKSTLPHRAAHRLTTRMLGGDAAHELIALAHRDHVDLIALGRHAAPLDSLQSAGPVVDTILDAAPCSLLIAPAPTTLAPTP